MDDLAAWLTQIWDEREATAKAAMGAGGRYLSPDSGNWETFQNGGVCDSTSGDTIVHDEGSPTPEQAAFIAANDPASVLARIAADRQILAMHTGHHECPSIEDNCGWVTDDRCSTVRLLALPHADRPGYQEAWRP